MSFRLLKMGSKNEVIRGSQSGRILLDQGFVDATFAPAKGGGDGVGLTYGTAIALIILNLPYAHLPILQR